MDYMLGSITIFAGNFPPQGWAYCNGQLLQINTNQALYSLLGVTYGGNGTTTFGLPDLRGRAPVHPGAGTGTVNLLAGQTAGNTASTIPGAPVATVGTFTLNANQLPSHNHPATVAVNVATSGVAGGDDTANGNVLASSEIYNPVPTTGAGSLGGVTATATVGNTGNGAAVTVNSTGAVAANTVTTQSPVLAINYIICTEGVYPSRP